MLDEMIIRLLKLMEARSLHSAVEVFRNVSFFVLFLFLPGEGGGQRGVCVCGGGGVTAADFRANVLLRKLQRCK